MNKLYKVGIYCRLSVDDASNSAKARNYIPADESVSIENQELLCKGWSHHLIHMTAVHLWQNGTLQL
ncbi:MAG: hypothetical protein K2L38_06945 [Dysosmobacter sp.]|nr:hypothetical protein [Dysosmobacter sp.]